MVKPVRQSSKRILFILCIVVIAALAVGGCIPACAGTNVTPSVTVAYKPAPTLHKPVIPANLPAVYKPTVPANPPTAHASAPLVTAAGSFPISFSYQGKLTDASGNPLTGTYTVTFNLYNVATGGTSLSTDSHAVQVSQGLFTTTLNFNPSVINGQALWLGIAVNTDPEMTPRQSFQPVPYALTALGVNAVTSSNADNYPVLARTTGSNSFGIVSTSAGDFSQPFFALTTGTSNTGMNIQTLGSSSTGVYVQTSNTSSPGVIASTSGANSNGIEAFTSGTGSNGVFAQTSGANTGGVTAYTFGIGSPGVIATTINSNSDGIDAFTSGTGSNGVYANTSGSGSPGFSAQTSGYGSDGITATTTNGTSNGVVVTTSGLLSDGIRVYTSGTEAAGVNVNTGGSGSHGVIATAAGPLSYGVLGDSDQSIGVYGTTLNPASYGVATPDRMAAAGGFVTTPVDVAEYMPASGDTSPGTVMVIGPEGNLTQSTTAYDTKVAGIISTNPGLTLGKNADGNSDDGLIAVAGRVPCKVDANYGAIHAGDLLTTSPTPGYAMKAQPANIRPGTVLGKAMGSLANRTGTINVIVTLQ